MQTFNAFRIHEQRAGIELLTLDQLSPGEVTIRVHWSGINYKDALAGTGKGRILRRLPLVGGVDLAGVVEASSDASIAVGEKCWSRAAGFPKRATAGMPNMRACRRMRW